MKSAFSSTGTFSNSPRQFIKIEALRASSKAYIAMNTGSPLYSQCKGRQRSIQRKDSRKQRERMPWQGLLSRNREKRDVLGGQPLRGISRAP